MVEFPLWRMPFLAVFAVLVGIAEPGFFRLPTIRVAPYAMAAILLAGGVWTANTWHAWRQVERVVLPSGPNAFRGVQPDALPDALRAARGTILEPTVLALIAIDAEVGADGPEHLLPFVEAVHTYFPTAALALKTVRLQLEAGRIAEAETLLRRIAASYPDSYRQFARLNEQQQWLPAQRVAELGPTPRVGRETPMRTPTRHGTGGLGG